MWLSFRASKRESIMSTSIPINAWCAGWASNSFHARFADPLPGPAWRRGGDAEDTGRAWHAQVSRAASDPEPGARRAATPARVSPALPRQRNQRPHRSHQQFAGRGPAPAPPRGRGC
ncbi:hypothetical protein G6F67_009690 [Rhizopus microsporus]|nr:hypothetical protein G6F67_009690 [Rhizopus microsporus]